MMAPSWQALAQQAAAHYGVPAKGLIAQIMAESGGNPHARSSAGAEGIAQFMPGTARSMGVNPWDPASAISGMAHMMRNEYNAFGSWPLALAAYNAGPGNARHWQSIPETRAYVDKLAGAYGSGAPAPSVHAPSGSLSASSGNAASFGDIMNALGISANGAVARYLSKIMDEYGVGLGGSGGAAAPTSGSPAVGTFAPGPKGHLFGGSYIPGRIDYGVDFGYHGNQKVPAYALAGGTVASLGSGWGHTNTPYQTGNAVYLKLAHPVHGYDYLYYAEGTPIPGLHVGQQINPGQALMFNPGEIGLIPSPGTSTMYQTPQSSGRTTWNWLHSMGIV